MKNLERERLYISGAMMNPAVLMAAPVAPSDMYDPKHQITLGALMSIASREGDVSVEALHDELQSSGRMREVGEEFLMDVTNLVELFAARHQKPLRELAHRRRVHERALRIARAAEDGDADAMQRAIDAVANQMREDATKHFTAMEVCAEAWETAMSEREKPRIRLGVPALDNSVGAVSSGSMIVVGARPNVGKSSLLLTMATAMANKGNPSAVISIEDPRDLWGQKILGELAGVNPARIRELQLSKDDYADIAKAVNDARNLKLFYSDDVGSSVEEVCESMDHHVRNNGAKCLFVDYLQRIRGDRRDGPRVMYGEIAQAIKRRAARLGVPVVLASQLKRGEKEFCEPTMSDLKETGAIEEMAEAVILLWKSSEVDRSVKCKVAKLKWAPAGKFFTMTRNSRGALVEESSVYGAGSYA